MTIDALDVETRLFFLQKDELYKTQKPYSIKYTPHGDIPQNNIKGMAGNGIVIRDLRPEQDALDILRHGMQIVRLPQVMPYEDFADRDKVLSTFFPDVQRCLADLFGTDNVLIHEYLVRRRSLEFPVATGETSDYAQPVAMAHIDFSENHVKEMLLSIFGKRDAVQVMRCPYLLLNIWKPLRGPLRDWPLALCEPDSLDKQNDLTKTDIVFADSIDEDYQIHHNKNQQWRYLSNQEPDELLLFRCVDSRLPEGSGVPHCAFENPNRLHTDPPRESIELRAFVFFGDFPAGVPLDPLSRQGL